MDSRIYLDVGEYFTMYERLIGDFEPLKKRVICNFLETGGSFLDIGVNKGDYALLAAVRVGVTGKVFAIEPAASRGLISPRSLEPPTIITWIG